MMKCISCLCYIACKIIFSFFIKSVILILRKNSIEGCVRMENIIRNIKDMCCEVINDNEIVKIQD